ncbi:MAG: alpha-mannosidase [bacterium]|nr:alpha-mannosidase [bacterium]MCP4801094.1 alpha-mannosidase [bacterium]
MKSKEHDLIIDRVTQFNQRLQKQFISDSIEFKAVYFRSDEPVFFADRLNYKYKPIIQGQQWGKKWDSAWFKLTCEVPEKWKGKTLAAHLDFSGEGLVFSPAGTALQGITNGSIFDPDFARTFVPLEASGKLELWVETAANSLFGVYTDSDPAEDDPNRYGNFDAKVESIKLVVFDEEAWHLHLDIRTLLGLVKRLPAESVQRSRIIKSLNNAVNNPAEARELLAVELSKPANASALEVTAVGHAHIDTAWLWPVRESVRKCARTFASQLDLIEKYPDYIFGASQPQHYTFIKEHYPEIYSRIKAAHKKGQWELQGGMWVEADCNLISGESMVRQILHGKNFFKDEFGVDVQNLWLPDVFGYSAAMPQILGKSGIKTFLTQKLSWSQFNEFPYHTFIWQGIDGSKVLTHFPPENTYNSQLDTEFLIPAENNFKEKDFINEFISLFGVGDGGGGPKPENIELGQRMANLEGVPKVKFGTAESLFEKLHGYTEQLETWSGELYLELHRGTYTTQAQVKKNNRQLEQKLRAVEYLWSCLPLDKYPDELDAIWKNSLMNQFHDILPGSSITTVYKTTRREQAESLAKCAELLKSGATKLFSADENSLVLMNVTGSKFNGAVELPESWNGVKDYPVQVEEQSIALVEVDPYSFLTLHKSDEVPQSKPGAGLVLENNLVRYEFAKDGTLISGFDKEADKTVLESGNIFTLYDDRPNNWDAWDIDFFYKEAVLENAVSVKAEPMVFGDVRQGLKFELSLGNSTITQKIYLPANSKRLDFETEVNWQEKHKMLRVAFEVNVQSDFSTSDIQYGYVKRPTHTNTSWDKARFEVAAQRYVDLSDNDYGVALLNDCKYGHRLQGNTLDLNLLRSPNNPDPDADIGTHNFKYSLYPHTGDLLRSDVISQAEQFNQGLELFENCASENNVPWKLTGHGLSIEAVKKAEKENCVILRIVETMGRHSEGTLAVEGKLIETDLMEWADGKEHSGQLQMKPFEIKTFKIKGN